MRPHFSLGLSEKNGVARQKEIAFTAVRRYTLLGVSEMIKIKRRRIDSATEFAAADPVLKEMPSTNLPKKSPNRFTEKNLWQVCAFAFTRKVRAAAEREAHRSSTEKLIFPKNMTDLYRLPQSGSLEPKRFKRRFGDFVAAGKVTRAEARKALTGSLHNTIGCCSAQQKGEQAAWPVPLKG